MVILSHQLLLQLENKKKLVDGRGSFNGGEEHGKKN
jgi:hypothetical protein